MNNNEVTAMAPKFFLAVFFSFSILLSGTALAEAQSSSVKAETLIKSGTKIDGNWAVGFNSAMHEVKFVNKGGRLLAIESGLEKIGGKRYKWQSEVDFKDNCVTLKAKGGKNFQRVSIICTDDDGKTFKGSYSYQGTENYGELWLANRDR